MKVLLLAQAADEFDEATNYYDGQQSGLGHKFRDEVDRHIRWIAQNAEIPRLRPGGYRRINLKVFPYFVAYLCKGDVVWILAIAHAHRKPGHWIGRKP